MALNNGILVVSDISSHNKGIKQDNVEWCPRGDKYDIGAIVMNNSVKMGSGMTSLKLLGAQGDRYCNFTNK